MTAYLRGREMRSLIILLLTSMSSVRGAISNVSTVSRTSRSTTILYTDILVLMVSMHLCVPVAQISWNPPLCGSITASSTVINHSGLGRQVSLDLSPLGTATLRPFDSSFLLPVQASFFQDMIVRRYYASPRAGIIFLSGSDVVNPNSAEGCKSHGIARAMLGQWEEAAKDLHLASKLDFDEELSAILIKKVEPKGHRIEEYCTKYDWLCNEREEKKNECERQRRKAEAKDLYRNILHSNFQDGHFLAGASAYFVAGSAAGCTTLIIIYPLDIAHTRLAADLGRHDARQFYGIYHFLRTINEKKGMRGIYRGLPASLRGMIVHRGLYFGGFDTIKDKMSSEAVVPLWKCWVVAQAVTTSAGLLYYPLDTVRRQMMMQSGLEKPMYRSILDCWQRIYKTKGFPLFYRGALSNIFRSTGAAAVLVLYDEEKKFMNWSRL